MPTLMALIAAGMMSAVLRAPLKELFGIRLGAGLALLGWLAIFIAIRGFLTRLRDD